MILEAIQMAARREALPQELARKVMGEIMDGAATDAQIAALATALKIKGETAGEISGFAAAMRDRILPPFAAGGDIVDTCGTGGDCRRTFNISTVAAFAAAGAGVRIAKHGNRSVSSGCGSADLLETLGVKVDIAPANAERCLKEAGMVFLFAPLYHGAMKHAARARSEIGLRTIFNILGPLTNPLSAKRQLVGVYDRALAVPVAESLRNFGTERAFVVHGDDGLDEISVGGASSVTELRDGRIKTYEFHPKKYGIKVAGLAPLQVAGRDASARLVIEILKGKQGPARDVVVVNAAFAIMAAGGSDDLSAAIGAAGRAIDSGAAMAVLEKLKAFSHDAA